MTNSTTYTAFRQPQDISVVDAAATTLLSYFLLRVIQWILASNLFAMIGRVILIFTISGIVATLFTSSTPTQPSKQRGFNSTYTIYTKNNV